jgi:hypothetical protein
MTRSISSSVTFQPSPWIPPVFSSGFVFSSISTTSFFLKALRLLKTAFPLPPHKKGGREKAKRSFGSSSWKRPGTNRMGDTQGHPLTFVTAALWLAQKLPCKGGREGKKRALTPKRTSETVHRPKSWSTGLRGLLDWVCWNASCRNGYLDPLAKVLKLSPIPEVPGAFVVFEGGDEVLSKKGNRGGITFVTPKFSFFETALRTQSPLSFIAVLPGPHFSVAQAGQCQRGWANLKSP